MSTIEEKKNEKLKGATTDKSNWVGFSISVLQNFIFTLLIGVLGANFIFLTSSNMTFIENILPTKEKSYFPQNDKNLTGGSKSYFKKGGDGGENYNDNCETGKRGFNFGNLNIFGIGGVGGWPYKYRSPYNETVGFVQDYINWIIDTIYGSFQINRGMLQAWLQFFSKENNTFLSNDTLQILLIAPLTFFGSLLAFPAGFFTSLFSTFNTNTEVGLWWAIVGLFLGYTWVLSSTISFVQFIQYLVFFTIVPLLSNLSKVKKILHCNITTLGMLFGFLVCGSAITNLDYVTSSVMIVVYILMAIKALW